MDRRLRNLAEQLDAGLIGRREFLRTSAVVTGGTAAGLHVMSRMAHAQSGTKMRVWLFKSFVTAGNDILAGQVEEWAKERKVGSPRAELHELPDHQRFPIGTGYWTRTNPEQCLLFTRGSPKRVSCNVRKLVVAPRREHSRKPDRIYGDVERLVNGPYLELFSRTNRAGWDVWGKDAGKFEEAAA